MALGVRIGDGPIDLTCLKGHRIAAVLKAEKEVGAWKLTQHQPPTGSGTGRPSSIAVSIHSAMIP